MKDIQITTEEYLMALQKEYFCADIRRQIYPHQNDKDYFKKLCDKKKEKIVKVCSRYKLKGIFDDSNEYDRIKKKIYTSGEFPNFIYNILNVDEKQLRFCYAGSAVYVNDNDKIIEGVVERVDFSSKKVIMSKNGVTHSFPIRSVKRMSHEETDRYFWKLNGHLVV